MNQGGLKHAATESRLDNKRERRRGASGRAAVLRRAPSDSDCSGETASLSADSGDRAVRPPPPPTRVAKSRSRRRGSEWEVLEGLKDGQRFEKRPDVFNGYLHKKRKWPLKGWHKRFFVVDGGILVYARSPTDVARGRLHGSVDVGLSVISAKARRRRIDIDADEFIYHLRAKTPDVFRTWLNVLKAHRLYRQHLLTFGARESVPKIHPPLEDLPPTETSSRTSLISFTTSTLTSNEDLKKSCSASISSKCQEVKEIPPNAQNRCNAFEKVGNAHYYNRSLCSMNCLTKLKQANVRGSKYNMSGSTNAEKQVHITDLESNSYDIDLPPKNETKKADVNDTKYKPLCPNAKKKTNEKTNLKNTDVKEEPTYYFFSRKKRNPLISPPIEPPMKKSKKCTNLVKYRNMADEPRLKDPPSKCLLLRQHNTKLSRKVFNQLYHRGIGCETILKESNQVQAVEDKEHKSLQDSMTASEYDRITEHLMISMFKNHKITRNANKNEIKYYINDVVKELYNVKFNQADIHPVKILFRSLLEYWFKNTSGEQFKEAMKRVKSVQKPSNSHFTRDKILSSFRISNASKQTQFHGISSFINKTGISNQSPTIASTPKPCKPRREKKTIFHNPKRDTDSFEKERHIQKLEKILKSTVYVCETVRSSQSREKDIIITKKLIDNLEKLSKKPVMNNVNSESVDKNNSSSEIPKLQETINHLISETLIPPDVAKEFLNAYLSILLNESTKSTTDSSSQSCEDQKCHLNQLPICDVQTESIQRKVSKHVSTAKCDDSDKQLTNAGKEYKHPPDPGELYLKDILDKITTMFTKGSKSDSKKLVNSNKVTEDTKNTPKDELGRSVEEFSERNLIHENYDENAVVIDLSKYDLEHISMFSDTTLKGMMSISIEMKEKPISFGGGKGQPLSLKLCNESLNFTPRTHKNDWSHNLGSNYLKQIQRNDVDCKNNLCHYDSNAPQDTIELKPYTSSSDDSSKPYCKIVRESEHSIDLSFQSSNFFKKDYNINEDEDTSCFIVSSVKKNSASSKTEVKKNEYSKRSNGLILGPQIRSPDQSSSSKYPAEYDLFEQPTPKVIDEKFILLLLENLMLLSKNLPTIYKDIRALYLKLKKKYEKVVRNGSNIQGLSLLGRIYNDDLKPNNRSIQFDEADFSETMNNTPRAVDVGVSTLTDVPILKILIDQSLSSYNLTNDSKTAEVQTDPVQDLKELMFKVSIPSIQSRNVQLVTKSKSAQSFLNRITTEQGVSCPNWHKKIQTKDCAVDTIIKTILRSPEDKAVIEPSKNFKNFHGLRLDVRQEFPLCRIQYNRDQILTAKKELVQGLAVLTPSLKTSTQSQTDTIFLKHSKDVKDNQFSTCNDFNIYRVVLCPREPCKSNSMISTGNRELSDDLKTIYRCTSQPSYCSGLVSPTSHPIRGPQAGFVSGTPGGRLASWIIESGGPLENASRELGQAQLSVQQLQRLLEALELQQQVHHDTDVSLEGASPNVKKDRRKFGLRKKKSNSKCASVELAPPHIDPSSSHMALSALTAPPSPGGGASSVPNSAASLPIACAAARPQSLPGAESLGGAGVAGAGPASITSLTPDHQLREDFTVLAKDLVASLKGIVSTLVCERGRLRAAMDAADTTATPGGAVVAALRTNLTSALHQNSELRSRLSRIHDASDLAEISSVGNNADAVNRQFQQSLSYSSSCVSASEFFDAEEHDDDLKPTEILAADEAGVIELDGDSSSEAGSLSSEEGSASSDNSDGAMLSAEQVTLRLNQNGVDSCWTRRTCLPRPRPTPGGPSLWNLLYKNIGKDLSQISMPVTINEPLNMLQRLCEELEYSELLDAAADCANAIERAALVASFAVSAYAASAHRAASKPFNPLLGETYECVRQDKGFRFLAEQVSHHPPISACHAESSRWCFWQEARIKTKFWGKSMEFQPTGRVHVRLITTGDHYSWNKVTTCVHNLFGGQRWVDQYGDMHITCHGTDISCKLNFIKASSWSSTRHEVRGFVTGGDSRLRLQGRWSEALYAGEPPSARALWRPGAMPPEHDLYYGFTRFAMELNEIEPGMRELLPPTDTRLRPDQRALEEGDVEAAEQYKHSLEQAQRERRRGSPEHTPAWFRKRVENGEETWVFTGEYWKAREAGFGDALPRIW